MSAPVVATALVVANSDDADPGFVGDRLEQRGYALRVVMRDGGEVPATMPGDAGLLLLLGSEWSVHEPVDVVARDVESALVRDAIAHHVPVLGLCYGAQVLAHALGGRVSRAPRPEIGLVEVATDDPALVPAGPWAAFHTDVIDPPPDATVVARNGCGVQAFVVPGVLAVQFHPEVRPEVLDDWASRLPELLAEAGVDREQLAKEAAGREDASRQAAYAMVDEFLSRSALQPG